MHNYRKPDAESVELGLSAILAASEDTSPIYPGTDGAPGSIGDFFDGGDF
jgi:hypothetical protein